MKERDKLKKQDDLEKYKELLNLMTFHYWLKNRKKTTHKTKSEEWKDDPKSIWNIYKEFGASIN